MESLRAFARIFPNGRIEEGAGVVMIAGGASHARIQHRLSDPPPHRPGQDYLRVEFVHGQGSGPPMDVVAYPGADTAIEAAALSAGFRPAPSDPGMLLDLVPSRAHALPTGFRVRRAATPELWNTMVNVGLVGMGGQPFVTRTSFPFRLLGSPRYVGFEGTWCPW